jgi:hypothetical protein
MAVVVHAFIYGKNFFDNPDREYTDFDEFKAVNNYSELSDFLDTMSSEASGSFEQEEALSGNKKLLLQKITFADELTHINAKGYAGRTDMFSDHNVIRVTEELYNEYK